MFAFGAKALRLDVRNRGIELAVQVAQLRGIGRNPGMLGEVVRQIAEQRRQSVAGLEKEKAAIEQEMEKTALEIGGLAWLAAVAGSTGAAAKSATDRLAELHVRAESQERRLAELRREIAGTGGNGGRETTSTKLSGISIRCGSR